MRGRGAARTKLGIVSVEQAGKGQVHRHGGERDHRAHPHRHERSGRVRFDQRQQDEEKEKEQAAYPLAAQ